MARRNRRIDRFWTSGNRDWAVQTVLRKAPGIHRADAEDIVQDTVVRLIEGDDLRFNPKASTHGSVADRYRWWVGQLLEREIKNRRQRERRREHLQKDWVQRGSGNHDRGRKGVR